jgi:hypothetical protein
VDSRAAGLVMVRRAIPGASSGPQQHGHRTD